MKTQKTKDRIKMKMYKILKRNKFTFVGYLSSEQDKEIDILIGIAQKLVTKGLRPNLSYIDTFIDKQGSEYYDNKDGIFANVQKCLNAYISDWLRKDYAKKKGIKEENHLYPVLMRFCLQK